MKKVFLLLLSVFIFLPGSLVLAADYTLLETVPFIGGAGNPVPLPAYLTGLYKFAIGTVGIAALLMLTVGGFWYMTSAGNQARAGNAKKIITDALLGLIMVFFTWLLLNTLNPDLLQFDPDTSQIQVSYEGYENAIKKPTPTKTIYDTTLDADKKFTRYDLAKGKKFACQIVTTDGKENEQCAMGLEMTLDDLKFTCVQKDEKGVRYWGEACTKICKDEEKHPGCTKPGNPPGTKNTASEIATLIASSKNISLQGGAKADCLLKDKTPASVQNTINELKDNSMATICLSGCNRTNNKFCDGKIGVSSTLLNGVLLISQEIPLEISSITGGPHKKNSKHYQGKAIDVVPKKNTMKELRDAFLKNGYAAFCDSKGVEIKDCSSPTDHVHVHVN